MKTSTLTSPWAGSTTSYDSFCEMIDLLPETISSIKVPTELVLFNPASRYVKPTDANWKQEIKDLVLNAISAKEDLKIDEFMVRCYYGKNTPDSSYYITLNSPAIREFNRNMSAGAYGSLD